MSKGIFELCVQGVLGEAMQGVLGEGKYFFCGAKHFQAARKMARMENFSNLNHASLSLKPCELKRT